MGGKGFENQSAGFKPTLEADQLGLGLEQDWTLFGAVILADGHEGNCGGLVEGQVVQEDERQDFHRGGTGSGAPAKEQNVRREEANSANDFLPGRSR